MQTTSKQHRKPTVEEFLQFIPRRQEYPWTIDENGIVHIMVPKFQSRLGKHLCRLIRKKNEFQADMDAIGSFIWQRCDGETSVQKILTALETEVPHQKNLDQRLYIFLTQMKQLDYLTF